MPVAVADPSDVARFLGNYTRQYNAGAFAHPTAKELAEHPERVIDDRVGGQRAVVVAKRMTRDSTRTDFTGRQFTIPADSYIATHIARTPHYLPDLSPYSHVMAYAEDRELSGLCAAMGKRIVGSRVTSAAEVINCWGPPHQQARYEPWDRATVADVDMTIDAGLREAMSAEAIRAAGWDDDFPYYSDGSWSAVCLKGYWRDEPGRGVKPAEMPRSWKLTHQRDLARPCEWTVLSDALPTLTQFVAGVPWWRDTERVRLLKMDAGGKLGRHTDITDRAGGTRDGQIVRFHVPLITHPAIHLHTWDVGGQHRVTHLQAWHVYYLDARKPHAVVNASPIARIHLVADVVADAAVRDRIAAAL
jgi:hypothetical protein